MQALSSIGPERVALVVNGLSIFSPWILANVYQLLCLVCKLGECMMFKKTKNPKHGDVCIILYANLEMDLLIFTVSQPSGWLVMYMLWS